jgi:hypothetical protein
MNLTAAERKQALSILRRAMGENIAHIDLAGFFEALTVHKRCVLERAEQEEAEEKVWGKGMGAGRRSFCSVLAAQSLLCFMRRYAPKYAERLPR